MGILASNRLRTFFAAAGLVGALLATAVSAHAEPSCGRPVGTADTPRVSDCRAILRSAVGLHDCALCVCDLDDSGEILTADALACLRSAVGLAVTLACPECSSSTTTTTTTTLPDPCPGSVEWTTHGRIGATCATNADCEAGSCDSSLGRCRTSTRIDIGWTGLQHAGDLNDGDVLKLKLDCDSAGPTCGQCAISGVDPSAGNCRCANDSRKTCSEPFAAASNECGGAQCRCYAGAPLPVVGVAPTCFLPILLSAPGGTIDVDSGEIDFSAPVRLAPHFGLGFASACPVCGGKCASGKSCVRDAECGAEGPCTFDAVPRDGTRGGVCIGGESDGLSCDVQAFARSLPQLAGKETSPFAGPSLDCLPSPSTVRSGTGVQVRWRETTSTSALASGLSCGGLHPDRNCPCLLCSGDTDIACQADSDCAGQQGRCSKAFLRCDDDAGCASVDVGPCRMSGSSLKCSKMTSQSCVSNSDCVGKDAGACTASTCSSNGSYEFPQPNECDDGLCNDEGQGAGQCATGPDDRFCSTLETPEGRGLYGCVNNDDCTSVLGTSATECSIVASRDCFADTIHATGQADPRAPRTGGTMCMPPFGSAGTAAGYGLPGPARIERQGTLRALCASDPSRTYEPGVGGCLD